MIPVGTAIIAYPIIIAMDEINFPRTVCGTMSPYPTVVTVTTAQYILSGILVKPTLPPSTTYIVVPKKVTIAITENRKILILYKLDLSALNKGTYFVKIHSGEETIVRKLMLIQ